MVALYNRSNSASLHLCPNPEKSGDYEIGGHLSRDELLKSEKASPAPILTNAGLHKQKY